MTSGYVDHEAQILAVKAVGPLAILIGKALLIIESALYRSRRPKPTVTLRRSMEHQANHQPADWTLKPFERMPMPLSIEFVTTTILYRLRITSWYPLPSPARLSPLYPVSRFNVSLRRTELNRLTAEAPQDGEPFEEISKTFNDIVQHSMHWQSPNFFGTCIAPSFFNRTQAFHRLFQLQYFI